MRWYAGARPAAVGLLAVAVLTAGCTSSKSGAGSATGAASGSATTAVTSQPASPAASTHPTPAVSGDPAAVKLYQQTVAALSKIDTVHVKGTGTQGGQSYSLDLSIAKGKGATGTVGIGGGTIHLTQTADAMYLQMDADTLKVFGGAAGGSVPNSVLNALQGKWLKVPTSMVGGSPLADFAQLNDLSSLAGDFAPQGPLSIKDRKQIDGKAAVGLLGIGSAGTGPNASVLYVEDGGGHLPLQYLPGGQGEFDFVDYGKPVTITAPASSDVVDLAQLQQLVAPTATPR